jgi:hypothetical protein
MVRFTALLLEVLQVLSDHFHKACWGAHSIEFCSPRVACCGFKSCCIVLKRLQCQREIVLVVTY